MKRLVTISLSIILVALASWGVVGAVTFIPHENPATAQTRFGIALPCLLHYSDILKMVAEQNYSEARLLLEQLKIDYAHLPEDIAFIMARYNDLIAQLSSRLDSLDNVLGECEVLLSQNRIQETHPKLSEAKQLIEDAARLIEGITKATDELINRLAPFILPPELEVINEAKTRLQQAVERLRELEAWYRNKLESFETTTEEKEELSGTELTLEIDPAQAWVGSSVTASGKLVTEEGNPITARDILVSLGTEHSITATKDKDGSYKLTLDIPYRYISDMTAQTSYLPQGEDKNIYLASSSPAKKIAILFHRNY